MVDWPKSFSQHNRRLAKRNVEPFPRKSPSPRIREEELRVKNLFLAEFNSYELVDSIRFFVDQEN